jgi:hypothetical protein
VDNDMNLLEYVSPEGDVIVHPIFNSLKKLILNPDENYWSVGSGQGYLTWYEQENIPLISLSLTFNEKNGFWLEYRDKRTQDGSYTSLGNNDFSHKNAAEVYICGDPLLLPSSFFITSEQACAGVNDFSKDGRKSDSIIWGIKGDQGWDYGDPEGFV